MEKILNDLNELKTRMGLLALSEPEKYKEFMHKLENIQKEWSENSSAEIHANVMQNIISEIVELEAEVNGYLKSGEHSINPFYQENKLGINKTKAYRINLYVEILNKLKDMNNPDIEKIKQIRQQWDKEKNGNLKYSPIEIKQVEDKLADTFIQIQIKNVQSNGMLLNEDISEFCEKSNYGTLIKDTILQKIQTMEEKSIDRLELEQIFIRDNIDEIVSDSRMWELVTGEQVHEKINKNEKQNTELTIIPKSGFIANIMKRLLSNYEVQSIPKLTLKIESKNIFGQDVIKTKRYKLGKDGKIRYPRILKDKIIEAVVPEGVKEIDEDSNIALKNNKSNFKGCSRLQKVVLPQTITTIGNGAFEKCENLEEINISEQLQHIGNKAFASTGLSSIILQGKTSYGKECFSNCKNLTDVQLSDSMREIPNGMFSKCTSLQQVILPKMLTKIGNSAFEQCESLAQIDFPEYLREMGDKAFASTALSNIILKGRTNYGEECFSNCKNLTDVQFSQTMSSIPKGMFSRCSSLQKVELPETLTKIGNSAFEQCENLEEINLAENLREIGDKAFASTALSSVLVQGEVNYGEECFSNCKNLTNAQLSQTVSEIPKGMFSRCSSLQKVELPQTLQIIGNSAFEECENLGEIDFPESLQQMGDKAFASTNLSKLILRGNPNYGEACFGNCRHLKDVKLSDNMRKVPNGMFVNCLKLKNIEWSDNITEIENGAFVNSGLTNVELPEFIEKIR